MFGFLKRSKAEPAQPATQPARRHAPMIRRNYYGAGMVDRLRESWTTNPVTVDTLLLKMHRTIVARSREAAASLDHVRKFRWLVRNNVIGESGIMLQAKPRDNGGQVDRLAARAIEDGWKEWSKADNCDSAGQLSFWSQSNMMVDAMVTSGEGIAVMNYGSDAGPWGFSLQLIDPIRLDCLVNEDLGGGRFIRYGIEYNRFARPMAYYFESLDPADDDVIHFSGRRYVRVPAERVLHLFIAEFIGQRRGIPMTATALDRMKMLGGYEDAALTNARVGASKMGFFRPGEFADDEDMPDDVDIPTEAEPGTYDVVPRGWEFQQFDPLYPSGEFSEFVSSCLHSIAVGMNVSYASLSGDLSDVNYTSIRHGLLEERDFWKWLQRHVWEQLHDKVFAAWLQVALLSGRLTVAGKPLRPGSLAKYREVRWQGRRWDWVDPEKEINAALSAVEGRIAARSKYIRDAGGDPDEVFEEIENEEKELRRRGLITDAEKTTTGSPDGEV